MGMKLKFSTKMILAILGLGLMTLVALAGISPTKNKHVKNKHEVSIKELGGQIEKILHKTENLKLFKMTKVQF